MNKLLPTLKMFSKTPHSLLPFFWITTKMCSLLRQILIHRLQSFGVCCFYLCCNPFQKWYWSVPIAFFFLHQLSLHVYHFTVFLYIWEQASKLSRKELEGFLVPVFFVWGLLSEREVITETQRRHPNATLHVIRYIVMLWPLKFSTLLFINLLWNTSIWRITLESVIIILFLHFSPFNLLCMSFTIFHDLCRIIYIRQIFLVGNKQINT